ncbi:succinate--CoA ligase subunit alpha [Candidatus Azoamicus ciliaticola]|uniref:Succinate--CoA ligase [ADP-forming] subunit alpha n=1 Tax=Candidatus Azoamicus ciliaticola TaxID=2652803 RepID=A0A6J5JY92_9GAMM|nr:succinate--CoA ligase subunit alpha [Candidatus Azoamicus ciliaticola]CAB3976502.1 Succinate--CoA ligase [ADP-forming] subunit alpha [Candidatus Azoamicus ciliaticola]
MNMNFFKDIKIVCHGFTGKMGTYHSDLSIKYNTNIVAGISPGKGGIYHLGKPVFDNAKDAVDATGANASIIFVPANKCVDSVLDAVDVGIKFIVCITEGIPLLDMFFLKKILKEKNVFFIGPNSPGLVVPSICRLGIMPINIHKVGMVGIVSRSGTLTYEAIKQTSDLDLGQSMSVGIGGDPIVGSNFIDFLKHFNNCLNTKVILLIGEIGGSLEEEAAIYLKNNMKKPVFAYIAGVSAPSGKRMGHAGAIIRSTSGKANEKVGLLKRNGVYIIDSIDKIGKSIKDFTIKN